MNTTRRNITRVMAITAFVSILWPVTAMAQHTNTRRNVDTSGSTTTATAKKNDVTEAKSSSTTKTKKKTSKSGTAKHKTITNKQEEVDDTPANYTGGFHFGTPTMVSSGNVASTNTPAYIFINRPMAIANGLNGASFKVVQKFLKTYYDGWERKEKKNESIMLSAAGGYNMSYAGITPTYVYANFEKKKFHDYAYYFMFSDASYTEADVRTFIKRFSDDLAKEGISLTEITPAGNERYHAIAQTDRKVDLSYEKAGAYYCVQLAVEF